MKHLFKVASQYHKKLAQQEEGPDAGDTEPAPPPSGVLREIDVPEAAPVPSFEEEEEELPETQREVIELKLHRDSAQLLLHALSASTSELLSWADDDEKLLNHMGQLKAYIERMMSK